MTDNVRTSEIAGVYFNLLARSWRDLLILLVGLWVSLSAFEYGEYLVFGEQRPDILALFGFGVFPMALFTAATAHRLVWNWQPSLSECFDVAVRAYLPVLAIVIAARVAATLGLLMMFIPGMIAIMALSIAPIIMIAERPGIANSLLDSTQRIFSAFLPVLGGYFIFILTLAGGAAVTGFATVIIVAVLPEHMQETLGGTALESLVAMLHTVFAVSVYLTIKHGRTSVH